MSDSSTCRLPRRRLGGGALRALPRRRRDRPPPRRTAVGRASALCARRGRAARISTAGSRRSSSSRAASPTSGATIPKARSCSTRGHLALGLVRGGLRRADPVEPARRVLDADPRHDDPNRSRGDVLRHRRPSRGLRRGALPRRRDRGRLPPDRRRGGPRHLHPQRAEKDALAEAKRLPPFDPVA